MKKILFTLLMILLTLVSWREIGWGYGETHTLINSVVYDNSRLDEYLTSQLKFTLNGEGRIAEKFLGKRPSVLFERAGIDEDGSLLQFRTCNHFHDPIKDWEHAGFKKFLLPDGISSLLWAQYPLLQTPPDGEPYTDRVIYFRGWTTDNIEVPHLAAADLLYKEWSQLSPAQQGWVPAHLDDYCYQDYALNLVPRAVSHGTALVDYFFRAKFAVTAEGSQLTVTNQSAGRAQGTVQVYADDAAGNRTLVFPTGSAVMNIDLQPDASVTSANAFSPPETTDLRYTMVFDGTIENTGAITVQDHAVGGTVFTWTPQTLPPIVAVGDNPRGMALTPGGLKGHVAQYRVIREQTWDGVPRTIAYYVWFVRDVDGLWRIDQF